jgi:hypothetical protein
MSADVREKLEEVDIFKTHFEKELTLLKEEKAYRT